MKFAFLAYLAFVGTLALLVLLVADRQMTARIDRLSNYRIPPRSALDAQFKLVIGEVVNLRGR